jgi:4-hydroxy-3-methylbut-2-en-1-yl diphosphate reductase
MHSIRQAVNTLEFLARDCGVRRASWFSRDRGDESVPHPMDGFDDFLLWRAANRIYRELHVSVSLAVCHLALEREGAIFVEDLDEVPEGQRVIFSAHGVAPREWERARDRHLRVIDATCPLVTKVHSEVERYAAGERTIILIGHAGHEEVKGTLGVAPGKMVLVGSVEEAEALKLPDSTRVAAVTQTTLSVDDTSEIIATLKRRFPALVTPKTDDICYATQNRQDAVKELVAVTDAILVVGSRQSSNANRMVEVARTRGGRAYLVDSLADVEPSMLAEVHALGLTASASAPDWLIEEIVEAFVSRGSAVELLKLKEERIHFPLPKPAAD